MAIASRVLTFLLATGVSAAALSACGDTPEPTTVPTATAPGAPAPGTDASQQQPASDPAPPDIHELPVTAGRVDMVTVKNGSVEVPGRFEQVTGTVSLDLGDLARSTGELTIALSSWASDEPTRDERLKGTFFQVADHPTATFALQGIHQASGPLMDNGGMVTGKAQGKLTWRAVTLPLEVPVELHRVHADAYKVVTPDPFDVKISDLQMTEQLDALIKLCQHESVDDVVKVKLDLTVGDPDAAPAQESTPAPADGPAPEGAAPAEGGPAPSEGAAPAEGAPPADGAPAPAEGAAPAEAH